MKTFASPFFWPLYSWIVFSIVNPTAVGNTQFVHVPNQKAMKIAISKNSPPMALLMGEELEPIKTEPEDAPAKSKTTILLSAGDLNLKPKAKVFAKSYLEREKEKIQLAKTLAPQRTRISELLSLVAPTNLTPINLSQVHLNKKESAVANERFPSEVNLPPLGPVGTVYVKGEESPVVSIANASRGLPRGEDKPVFSVEQKAQSKASPSSLENKVNWQSVIGKDNASNNLRIFGTIELSGGLALTQDINDLRVYWKTGTDSVEGKIDDKGRFIVDVAHVGVGKLVATLSDRQQKLMGRGVFDLNDLSFETLTQTLNSRDGFKILIQPSFASSKMGEVISAYSFDQYKMLVPGAYVLGPNYTQIQVGLDGRFEFSGLTSDSSFILEAGAPNYWRTRIITDTETKDSIPLFSDKMIESLFDLTGQKSFINSSAVVWGQASKKGKPMDGVRVSINVPGAFGPIYFNDLRIPDMNLKSTSKNGLFAFIKIPKGLHVVTSHLGDHELPSFLIPATLGVISYVNLKLTSVTARGVVFDPLLKQNIPAQLNIIGSSRPLTSGQNGFEYKWPSADPVAHINLHGGPEYFVQRQSILRSETKSLEIPLYQKSWLFEELSQNKIRVNEGTGMFVGFLEGTDFKVSLDREQNVEDNIFYFDEKGKISVGKMESAPNGGGFLITNLSPGIHTLIVTSSDGELNRSHLFIAEPGILNVLGGSLKP